MGRRQGPSGERRAAILAAADAVFTQKGYSGASIREIAKRAEVSSALLYWFFPNKARLFAAVMVARVDAMGILEFPEEVLAIPPDVFLPQIARGYRRVLEQGSQLQLMKLVLRDADREPELTAALAQAITTRVLGPMRTYVAYQMDRGLLRRSDPDYVTQAFLGMLLGLLLRREILQEPASQTWDLEEYGATAARMFLEGALAPPGTAPEPPVAPPKPGAAGRQREAQRITIDE
ncbi:MAG TPA: TetR/AcrR family transcriptional regulator [Chloroflexia bacterium]|nr:TetR/AcrR family transcriptional regulator [Chloroflexia bacterium]